MKIKLCTKVLAPEDDLLDYSGGDSGAQAAAPASPETPAQPPATPPTTPAQPAPTPQVVLSQEQLEKIVGARPPAPAPAAPQLSQAEQDKLLRRFSVTQEMVNAMFSADAKPEARVALFQQMLDGAAEHAFHVSQLKMQKELDALNNRYQQEFNPVREYYQRQQQEAAAQAFYGKYPQLKQHEQLVQLVAGSIKPDMIKGMNPAQVEQFIAEQTLSNLKNYGIDPGAGGQPQAQPNTPQVSQVPRSQALAGGGRSQVSAQPTPSTRQDEGAWLDRA